MTMNIVPMQPVHHLPRSIAFYASLGFTVDMRNDDWGWASLRFGDARVMLDQSINPPPGSVRTAVLYLYPDDIVAYHAGLRARGLDVPDLHVTFYGLTEFRIDDPDGNRLWIGQDTSDG